MSNEIDNIKQANTPIQEFYDIGDKVNLKLSGAEIAAVLATKKYYHETYNKDFPDSEMIHSSFVSIDNTVLHEPLQDFILKNSDNKHVSNPWNNDFYETEQIHEAYDRNHALSNWNHIKADYADNMTNAIKDIQAKSQEALSVSDKENLYLTLGTYIQKAENKLLNKSDIDYMLTKATSENHIGIDVSQMDNVLGMLERTTPDKIDKILEYPRCTQDAIRFYIDSDNYNPDAIDVIGSCKSTNMAYNIMLALNQKDLTLKESRDLVNAANRVEDYYKNPDKTDDFFYDIMNKKFENPKSFTSDKFMNYAEIQVAGATHTDIVIPKGLVSDKKTGEFGDFYIVKVPVDNKMGTMTVAESCVNIKDKTAVLNLPNRDREVKFYDKVSKTYNSQKFSVSELSDVYTDNWIKLSNRNKVIDNKLSVDKTVESNKDLDFN